MKNIFFFLFASTATLTSPLFSAAPPSRDVIKETYIAKYLGPTSEQEWEKRGGNGQVIKILSDGVTVTSSYTNHHLQGKTTYTYPHTNIPQFSENYEQGRLIGKTTYFTSGLPESEENILSNGLLKISSWYTDGVPSSVEEWKGTQLVTGSYFDKSSEKESSVQEGRGIRIARDAYGTLISRDTFANGQIVRKETFYSSGEPKSSTPYINGKIHGLVRTYLMGGEPLSVEEWSQGQKQGACTQFENGEPHITAYFANDQKHGLEQHFKNGTQVVEEIHWKEGKKHGLSCVYINGEAHEQWYYEDKRVNAFTYQFLTPGQGNRKT
ncbi:MAG: hypothetical protein P4L16_06195 [Chlamydiales bacterium]|nr:hypothetical protein [Chlamydiales bacterium]